MTIKFRLEGLDGEPFDPPTYATTVHRWSAGDRIPIKPGRTQQVVRVRDDDADQAPVLVVEDLS